MPGRMEVGKRFLERFFVRLFGKRTVTIVVILTILATVGADFFGRTIKGWSFVKGIFQEQTSLLNTAELEVMDEWVVLIDIARSFDQAEAYRRNLAISRDKFTDDIAGEHFTRNLRVVRDPHNSAYWLLVADINSRRSTMEEVEATIACIKSGIASWEEDDIISPWLENSRALDYNLDEFANTYGRIENIPKSYTAIDRKQEGPGNSICPPPYG